MKTIRNGFSQTVLANIGYYVYALLDPRQDSLGRRNTIFYIGKGKGNRMFNHVIAASKWQASSQNLNKEDLKYDTINAIQQSGLQVGYLILHHGLTHEHALLIESALIDFITKAVDAQIYQLSGLANLIGGYDNYRGIMTLDEIESRYGAYREDCVEFDPQDGLIMAIRINVLGDDESVIKARTEKEWRVNRDRANKVNYVLACRNGRVVGIFTMGEKKWYLSGDKRYRFDAVDVDKDSDVYRRYFGKKLIFRKGSANPITYFNE